MEETMGSQQSIIMERKYWHEATQYYDDVPIYLTKATLTEEAKRLEKIMLRRRANNILYELQTELPRYQKKFEDSKHNSGNVISANLILWNVTARKIDCPYFIEELRILFQLSKNARIVCQEGYPLTIHVEHEITH